MNQPILTSRNALGRFFFLPALFLILIQNGTAPALQGVTGDSLPDYIWPTNASRTLSSSFAETREGHFHFGIDIRTNSSVGYPCYAVEDGDVVRVRVSPYGYGRALYLKLKDGRTAVYAHLQRFAPPVEKIVRKKQYQHRSFRCQIYFKPGEIPFKKGDIVAYSGSSGIGHPHLHFEIRDDEGYLNPNLFGFVVEDSRPPVAEEIALIPLDVESEIEANFEPKIYSLKSSERGFTGFYKLEEIPEVYGKFGMGISGYDLADGADNKMSFYGLDFYIDDSLCFSVTTLSAFRRATTASVSKKPNRSNWRGTSACSVVASAFSTSSGETLIPRLISIVPVRGFWIPAISLQAGTILRSSCWITWGTRHT